MSRESKAALPDAEAAADAEKEELLALAQAKKEAYEAEVAKEQESKFEALAEKVGVEMAEELIDEKPKPVEVAVPTAAATTAAKKPAPKAPRKFNARVKIGDTLPNIDVEVGVRDKNGKQANIKPKSLGETLGDGTTILIGMPGAFTPTCNDKHLPGLFAASDKGLFDKVNVSTVAVITTNDRFVNSGWAQVGKLCRGAQACRGAPAHDASARAPPSIALYCACLLPFRALACCTLLLTPWHRNFGLPLRIPGSRGVL